MVEPTEPTEVGSQTDVTVDVNVTDEADLPVDGEEPVAVRPEDEPRDDDVGEPAQ